MAEVGVGFHLRYVNQGTASTSFVAICSRTNGEIDRQEPNLWHVKHYYYSSILIGVDILLRFYSWVDQSPEHEAAILYCYFWRIGQSCDGSPSVDIDREYKSVTEKNKRTPGQKGLDKLWGAIWVGNPRIEKCHSGKSNVIPDILF